MAVSRALLVLLYAALCGVEFLISWAKEALEERIKKKPKNPDEREEP